MTAHITKIRTAAETALAEQFAAAKAALPGDAGTRALRERAASFIAEQGLPHGRIEHWHYTDLRGLMRDAKPLATVPDAGAITAARARLDAMQAVDACRVVLLDGTFLAELSDLATLPEGVRVLSMASMLSRAERDLPPLPGVMAVAENDHALALNSMFTRDGVMIIVADGANVARPVRIVNMRSQNASTSSYARSLVHVGKGASLFLMELCEGGENAVVQINDALGFVLDEGASVEHAVTQRLPLSALHLATITAELGPHATFNSFALTLGAGVSRRQLYVRYAGEHARSALSGASLLKGEQHADTTLIMDHAVAHGESRELFTHVLDGRATGVYQGKVVVRQHAQKTDGGMKSKALVLSDDATMLNKPELEIFADDVVCGHGATVGALEDDHLFYLMARGIGRAEAEALLIAAFVGEAVETVPHEGLREALMSSVERWLAAR
jgi:Fe-S cluster assembly protein SufD